MSQNMTSANATSSVADEHAVAGAEISARMQAMNDLTLKYVRQGRFHAATPLVRRTIVDLKRTLGDHHSDVATMLDNYALICSELQQYQEGVNSLLEALVIREGCFGLNSMEVAATLKNLSTLCSKGGSHVEAKALLKRALRIREALLGPHHPDVAALLRKLGLVYQHMNKFDEAVQCLARAADVYAAGAGPDSAEAVRANKCLHVCKHKQVKWEAEQASVTGLGKCGR